MHFVSPAMYSTTGSCMVTTVVEIRVRKWSTVFEDRTFCRLLIAVTLKMYSKFGQPNRLLKNGQWPAAISNTVTIINGGK